MAYLIDTNVLLRTLQPADSDYLMAVQAVDALFDQNEDVYVTPQNLIEFWSVATRPQVQNGLGLTSQQISEQLEALEAIFHLLPENPQIYAQWRRLVVAYEVSGVQVHDARLAASALAHNVSHVLTFNGRDFTRFAPEGLTVVHPSELASV
jgi:predicted nucleic acid-binding protein